MAQSENRQFTLCFQGRNAFLARKIGEPPTTETGCTGTFMHENAICQHRRAIPTFGSRQAPRHEPGFARHEHPRISQLQTLFPRCVFLDRINRIYKILAVCKCFWRFHNPDNPVNPVQKKFFRAACEAGAFVSSRNNPQGAVTPRYTKKHENGNCHTAHCSTTDLGYAPKLTSSPSLQPVRRR